MHKIYGLIPKIMAEIGSIGKNRKNTQGSGYAFRGIDDAYNAIQPALIKFGVFVAPKVVSHEREERQSKAGGNLLYTILTVSFTFFADDGFGFEVVTIGEAMDSGDKSANKAMSAALKYAFFQVFCIPTEGDNDTENQTPEVLPKTGKQRHLAETAPISRSGTCSACQCVMKFTEKTKAYYCSNFKDKSVKHDYITQADLDARNSQTTDPFSEGLQSWEKEPGSDG